MKRWHLTFNQSVAVHQGRRIDGAQLWDRHIKVTRSCCSALCCVNCDLCDPASESGAVWSELSLPRRPHAPTNSQNNTWPWRLAAKSMIIASTEVSGIGALVIFLHCVHHYRDDYSGPWGVNEECLLCIFDSVKLGRKPP